MCCCYVCGYVNLFMDHFVIQTNANIVDAHSLTFRPTVSSQLCICFFASRCNEQEHYKLHHAKHRFCSRFATLGCPSQPLYKFTFADENLWKAHWLPPLGEQRIQQKLTRGPLRGLQKMGHAGDVGIHNRESSWPSVGLKDSRFQGFIPLFTAHK